VRRHGAGPVAVRPMVTVRPVTEKAPDALSPRRAAIQVLFALVLLMWGLEVVDAALDNRLDRYGIEPREVDGLDGVVAAPFLHVGFGHLAANTLPFVAMGLVIALEGPWRLIGVTAIVALVSGLGTWLIAPADTIHLGASGVVFGFATYLIARGWFNRRAVEIAIGVAVAVLWGGALLAGLEPQEGISWQGHLFGAIGGVVAARALSRRSSGVDPDPGQARPGVASVPWR
jgi:membrane associated rhomboid family serine protease